MLDDGWMVKGACYHTNDPDKFFPETTQGLKVDANPAKRVCKTCPVKVSCLFYAIGHDEKYGVWGGLTMAERRRISKPLRRRIKASWFKRHPYSIPG